MQGFNLASAMQGAVRGGTPAFRQLRQMMRLRALPNGIDPFDYYRYALFDERHDDTSRAAFIGRRGRVAMFERLCRPEWRAAADDKLLAHAICAGAGVPVPGTLALAGARHQGSAVPRLADAAAIEAWLLDPDLYPLIVKPVDGIRSAGVMRLERLDAIGGRLMVELAGREPLPLSELAHRLADYPGGYLMQRPVALHPDLEAAMGPLLSTCRVMLHRDGEGVETLGCSMKICGGGHVADNFWREGNLLAAIDPDSGRLARIVDSSWPRPAEHESHPRTGAMLKGLVLPGWQDAMAMCRDLARLFAGLEVISFDIALTASGPLVVEVNPCGDALLVQLPQERGILTPRLVQRLQGRPARAKAAGHPSTAAERLVATA